MLRYSGVRFHAARKRPHGNAVLLRREKRHEKNNAKEGSRRSPVRDASLDGVTNTPNSPPVDCHSRTSP